MNKERNAPAHLAQGSWRASSYSGGQGNCLEVADHAPHRIPVRDSKRSDGRVIVFTHDAWRDFLTTLK
ncbi:DUF397 domain-containing protein [Streptomyces sp. NPDC003077]|uniref:DUF397 domain-containing protein n=1 Tax=Streptomyces sp. NPDC003077 TaxID=3154443 RepID=UPI00339DD0ED